MNQPTPNDINSALESIAAAERDPNHPRSIARKAVAEWRSNAECEGLPLVNRTHTGAPLLDTDAVLERSLPDYGRKG